MNVLKIGKKIIEFANSIVGLAFICLVIALIIPSEFKNAIETITTLLPAKIQNFFTFPPIAAEKIVMLYMISILINIISLFIFLAHEVFLQENKNVYETITSRLFLLNSILLLIILITNFLYEHPFKIMRSNKGHPFFEPVFILFVSLFVFIYFGRLIQLFFTICIESPTKII